MNPEINDEEAIRKVAKNNLNRVASPSKYIAIALFIILPFLGGWIWYRYASEKIVEVEKDVYIEKAEYKIETTMDEGYVIFFDNNLGYWRVFTPSDPEVGYKFMTESDARRFVYEDRTGDILVSTRTYTDEVLGFSIDYPGHWFVHTQEFLGSKDIIVSFGNARIEYSSGVYIEDFTTRITEKLGNKKLTIENIKEIIDFENLHSDGAQLMGMQDQYSSSIVDLGGYKAVLAVGETNYMGFASLLGSVTTILADETVVRIKFFEEDNIGSKNVALSFRRTDI